jgi:hypothetical protein
MSRYEAEFGTDWGTLDAADALVRAFALGVSASLGDGLPEEYDRVLATADGTYDRSLLELAYHEGFHVGAARSSAAADETDDEVWSALLDELPTRPKDLIDFSRSGSDAPEAGDARDADSALPAVLSRIGLLDKPVRDFDGLRLPEFLERP